MGELQVNYAETMENILDLARWFGEKVKPIKFKTEKFFGIFDQFRKEFMESRDKTILMQDKMERSERLHIAKMERLRKMKIAKAKKKKQKRQQLKSQANLLLQIREYKQEQ